MTTGNYFSGLFGEARRRLRGLDPQQRHDLVSEYFPKQSPTAQVVVYVLMLTLAVGIAAMGLMTDSTAVVIGAMLLSPLMTPTIGTAIALVMVWPHRLTHAAVTLLMSTFYAVALGSLVATLTPWIVAGEIPGEIIARTQPTLADLFVALFAGFAGAIAAVRKDVSPVVPGVAIAVAMVPPLVSAGILFGIGEPELAFNALLLYLTNVISIVLAAAVVLLSVGFVPRRLLKERGISTFAGVMMVALIVALTVFPLSRGLQNTVQGTRDRALVKEAVSERLGPQSEIQVLAIEIADDEATIEIAGEQEPPSSMTLARLVNDKVGRSMGVRLYWIPSQETYTRVWDDPAPPEQ
jgi:uncharacterized hydrophobic protein (TIGR00271 family)